MTDPIRIRKHHRVETPVDMTWSSDPSATLSFERASALCVVYFDWGTTVLTGREKNKTFPAFSSPANAERARPKSSDSRGALGSLIFSLSRRAAFVASTPRVPIRNRAQSSEPSLMWV